MSVSNKLVSLLIKNGTIKSDDRDLYVYGIHQACLFILNIATTIVVGLILGMLWEGIAFSLAYIPMRTYAGGYHSKTQFRCYLLSIAIITASLLAVKFIPWNGFICTVIMLCAGLVVLILAPVEDRNKPLDEQEKAVYRKRTYAILGVLVGIALLSWFTGSLFISISIAVALFVLSIMLVFGILKNNFNASFEK